MSFDVDLEVTVEEAEARLARYDIVKHPEYNERYSVAQYPHLRRCAVLIPLFYHPRDGYIHVLLTQRTSTLSSHASVVAFPGGRQDPTDVDDVHTALREAQEEVGLDPSKVKVLARVPPCFVRPTNAVFPVVAFIPPDFEPIPNPGEVQVVFSMPLWHCLDRPRVHTRLVNMFGSKFPVPYMTHVLDDDTPMLVWGFTLMQCIAVARTVLGPCPRYFHLTLHRTWYTLKSLSDPALTVSMDVGEQSTHKLKPQRSEMTQHQTASSHHAKHVRKNPQEDGQERKTSQDVGRAWGNSDYKERVIAFWNSQGSFCACDSGGSSVKAPDSPPSILKAPDSPPGIVKAVDSLANDVEAVDSQVSGTHFASSPMTSGESESVGEESESVGEESERVGEESERVGGESERVGEEADDDEEEETVFGESGLFHFMCQASRPASKL